MIPIVYFAHRVAPSGSATIADNLAAARRWLRTLIRLWPAVSLSAAWLPYLDVLDDGNPDDRDRGIRDGLAVAERCDGIVLTGVELSRGMAAELDVVRRAGGFVVDLVGVDLDDHGTIRERCAVYVTIGDQVAHLGCGAPGGG